MCNRDLEIEHSFLSQFEGMTSFQKSIEQDWYFPRSFDSADDECQRKVSKVRNVLGMQSPRRGAVPDGRQGCLSEDLLKRLKKEATLLARPNEICMTSAPVSRLDFVTLISFPGRGISVGAIREEFWG
jgi:hypothetical protein